MPHLRGLTWQHVRGFQPLIATAAAYQRLRPDVTIAWEQLPWSAFGRTSHREMASRSGRYDLYLYDHPWVGDYTAKGWLIPLDERLTAVETADLEADADPASLQSYRWADHLWGLPVDAACLVTVFRPDLVETTELPRNWDDFLDYASVIHHPPQRYAFSVPWGPASGANSVLFFLSLLAAAGDRPFEDETRLTIDPRIGRRALEIMRRIWELSVPANQVSGGRGYDLLLQDDRAALVLSSFAYINYFGQIGARQLAVADSPILPETGVKTSLLGGMGLGISVDTRYPDFAWDYARYVMSREVQGGIYIDNEGQPGRLSALSNPTIDASRDGFCKVLKQALTDCYIRPQYPGWLTIENGTAPALNGYLAGEWTEGDVFAFFRSQAQKVWER